MSRKSKTSLESIAVAASAAAAAVELNPDHRIAQLEERIAKLEPLLEEKEQATKFDSVFSDYVKSLKAEQSFLNAARWVFGVVAVLTILAILIVLLNAIFNVQSPLLKDKTPPVSVAIFVVGSFSAIAVLLNGIMKGLLRSASERHSDGFLPPQMDAALKLFDRLKGQDKGS